PNPCEQEAITSKPDGVVTLHDQSISQVAGNLKEMARQSEPAAQRAGMFIRRHRWFLVALAAFLLGLFLFIRSSGENTTKPVDRYQIVQSADGKVVRLDKMTGEVESIEDGIPASELV